MLGKYLGKLLEGHESVSNRLKSKTAPRLGELDTSSRPSWRPKWLHWPSLHSFNFILLHYMYVITMTLLFSLVIWAERNMSYTNALFFAAGGVTQSGLNPIDFNLLTTYQQIVLLMLACLCNPIVINTFVVFVRLYWFEKRFQNVIRSAADFRRARTQSRAKDEEKKDLELAALENGVGDREIRILHNRRLSQNTQPPIKTVPAQEREKRRASEGSTSDSAVEDTEKIGSSHIADSVPARPLHRDIVFEDEVAPKKATEDTRLSSRSPEQHIAFVENQRRPRDTGVLRIPGPRDFDRGVEPERIERDEEDNNMQRPISRDSAEHPVTRRDTGEMNMDDHPLKEEFSGNQKWGKIRKILNHIPFLARKSTKQNRDSPHPTFKERAMSHGRSIGRFLSQEKSDDPNPYLSYAPTIGRNSTFVNLTEEQREELGGIEYRSLKTLAYILLAYFFGWAILSIVIFLPWILNEPHYKTIVQSDGQGVPWWGVFTPLSHFTDLGFTLTPDSMISFQTAVMPMIVGSFFIIIGNTGFPCMLRLIIWTISKLVPRGSGIWEELRFLLDHPRRCFTLLFPRHATWWLFAVLVILNGIDVILFIILDLNDPTVSDLSPGIQFLDGLYQAAATRTAGFSAVNLAALHPAIQVSYLIMMYISVFPIAISVRRTNVYEEKSLGVYPGDEDEEDTEATKSKSKYLSVHLRRQLSFDLWFVFLGLFLVCIIEGGHLANTNEYAFTIFSVLFEIVSAYGTVGLSLGYPNTNASFSAQFKNLSKLIIIAMMIRGRHRGLPYALDRAILLPSESLQKKEMAEDDRRRQRRASMASSMHYIGDGAIGTASGFYLHGIPMGTRTVSAAITEGDGEPSETQRKHGRSRSRGAASLAKVLSGALSAGPTGRGPPGRKHI